MKTLVAGGTGFVGTALVRELTARGHEVTVLARTPEGADLPGGVNRVACDLARVGHGDLLATVAGHDAVVNLVALSPLFAPSGGNEMHERVHLDGTRKLVAAAEAAGEGREEGAVRFVQMSALGADPDGATHYIRAKGEAEAVVRDSGLDWVVVRPSVVFGDGDEFVGFTRLLTTPYVTGLPGGGRTPFQPIWVGDLAPMLADCAVGGDGGGSDGGDGDGSDGGSGGSQRDGHGSDGRGSGADPQRHVGRTYELGGPEVLTLADVARRVYEAEGKSLVVLPVPMVLAGIGLTLAGFVPGVPMGGDQYRSLRFDNTVGGGDPSANDVAAFDADPSDLRTLRSYLCVDDAGEGSTGAGGATGNGEATGVGKRNAPEESDCGAEATDGGVGDAGGERGDGLRSLLVGRDTLALFAFLAVSWLVPEVAATRLGVDLYATGLIFLYVPSYLVSMVFYDGLLGLENVAYAVQDALPVSGALVWDAGLLVTYYLFAVVAVAVGRALRRRFGPRSTRRNDA